MEHVVHALCVRATDFGEADRMITLCTSEKGRISVKATGCRRAGAKLRYAAEPFCFGEYTLVESRDRYIMKGCDLCDGFPGLVRDIKLYYAGFTVLEWMEKLTFGDEDVDNCRSLLLCGTETLKELCYEDRPPEEALTGFVRSALEALGYGLNFETSAASGRALPEGRVCYDFAIGGIVSCGEGSPDRVEFGREEVSALKGEGSLSPEGYGELLRKLEGILKYSAGIKASYSLSEFLKL